VARTGDPGEILKRALGYPYERPAGSFRLVEGRVEALDPSARRPHLPAESRERTPLIAYGANASPQALRRKLGPRASIAAVRAELSGFAVVYSAHVSPYGAVPSTLVPDSGTKVDVHVLWADSEQLPLLSATEPNYELTRLEGVELIPELGPPSLPAADAYVSRHGPLLLDGAPVPLGAMSQPELQELVRSHLAPEASLEEFVLANAARSGLAPLPELHPP
jgi:hypothetical protein